MKYLPKRCASFARRFADDRRGVSLIEFAFALPILVLLYIGGYQLTDALTAYRKVTIATRTIADITSQFVTLDDTDLDTILNASQQVMAPYSPNNAKMTVSQIIVDNNGNATVDWSRGKNTSKLPKGQPFNVPAAIKQKNTSIIVADITYSYVPTVASSMFGTIPFHDQIVMGPRATDTITYK